MGNSNLIKQRNSILIEKTNSIKIKNIVSKSQPALTMLNDFEFPTFSQLTLEDFFEEPGPAKLSGFEKHLNNKSLNPNCPVCLIQVQDSSYLHDVFFVEKNNYYAYCVAVFVTHYRHKHQKSWDKLHSSYAYQQAIPKYQYDTKKIEYNNQAKRQLIRAISKSDHYTLSTKAYLISAFEYLKYNDQKTKELMNKAILKLLKKYGVN